MVYKRIDTEKPEYIEGYSFVDRDGVELCVSTADGAVVNFLQDGEFAFEIYYSDIPLMIKALKASYQHGTDE